MPVWIINLIYWAVKWSLKSQQDWILLYNWEIFFKSVCHDVKIKYLNLFVDYYWPNSQEGARHLGEV